MSRIGKQPVALPAGCTAEIQDGSITIKGPKGELALPVPAGIQIALEGNILTVTRDSDTKQNRANHGTTRAHLANMALGVTQGYVKELEIQGVGYRATAQGQHLSMQVGYSHSVEYDVPETVKLELASDGVNIKISGVDKQQVGLVAARIRAFCPPEPYKGKGIRYKGENVRRKVGKTVA